jgi:hypothetical protein
MIASILKDSVLVAALAAAIAGRALALIPAPQQDIPPFAPAIGADAASAETRDADLTRLAQVFDHANLPAPEPLVVPPPDPAAVLKRHRYLGSAAAEERQRALFELGGAVRVLAPGEALEGFSLTRIDRDGAVFVKDGVEVALPLSAE